MVGKSHLALDMAIALISGESAFLGQPVAMGGEHRVLYASTDLGADEDGPKRFRDMVGEHGIERFGDRIRFGLPPQADPSDRNAWLDWWKRRRDEYGTTIVILDSITMAAGESAELNSTAGAGPVLGRLMDLVQEKATVVAIGHTSKSTPDSQGGRTTMLGTVRFQASFRRIVHFSKSNGLLRLAVMSNNSAPLDLWTSRGENMRVHLVDAAVAPAEDGQPARKRGRRRRAPVPEIRAVYDNLVAQLGHEPNESEAGRAVHEAGLSDSAAGGIQAVKRARKLPGWSDPAPAARRGTEH
jgi:hypothetical protein